MKKLLEDYDFIKFKNKKIESGLNVDIDFDLYLEYVIEKFKNNRFRNIVNLIIMRDRSLEVYDVAVDIAINLRNKKNDNDDYIPTAQHIYRLLLNKAKCNKILNNDIDIVDDTYSDNYKTILMIHDLEYYLNVYYGLNIDEKDIKVLFMYLNKYTYTEISDFLNCSDSYANRYVSKLINKIKNEIGKN